MKESVWETRWAHLRDLEMTKPQAVAVWVLIDEVRGFHSDTLAAFAWNKLEAAWADWKPMCMADGWCDLLEHRISECDSDCENYESSHANCELTAECRP